MYSDDKLNPLFVQFIFKFTPIYTYLIHANNTDSFVHFE